MNEITNAPENNQQKSYKFTVIGSLGILLALLMSGLALYLQLAHVNLNKIFTVQPQPQYQEESTPYAAQHVSVALDPQLISGKAYLIQALNLLYAADFSFNILHNKAQSLQIIAVVKSLLDEKFTAEIESLANNLDKSAVLDKVKVLVSLAEFKTIYLQLSKQGKFSNKTFAQIIKVEDTVVAKKQAKLLEDIQILQLTLESDNSTNLSLKIGNIVESSKELDDDLGQKAAMLTQFIIDDHMVSFEEMFNLIYQQLGSK